MWGNKHPAALFQATPSRPRGAPHPHPPKQPVNLDGNQPLTGPASVRTSPPCVQQCPLPPATAFPHPQRFTAEPSRKHPSSRRRRCLTSAHLLWHSSLRRWRRLVVTGGTSTTWRHNGGPIYYINK